MGEVEAPSEEHRWRATFCDLLIGRWMRALAQRELDKVLEFERIMLDFERMQDEQLDPGWKSAVDEQLDAAAHYEWIAVRAEWGQILWGGRLDRHGRRPEDG